MRAMLYGGAALALTILSAPDTIRTALATSASALVEATPFVFAGVALGYVLRRSHALVAHLGCGCSSGPAACSLPAAAATWMIFGPLVALARYAAASLVARALRLRREPGHGEGAQPLDELTAVFPAALAAGVAAQFLAGFEPARLSPIESVAIGAALGFFASGCGLGSVALAGALKVHAPLTAAAFLCIAGIVDIRALQRTGTRIRTGHDALAYALLAAASAVVAWRHGDALVHPALALPLWGCAASALFYAVRFRMRQCSAARIAPTLMLAGALIGAPPPVYRATETTLSEVFAGERLSFTGVLECDKQECALVRYAITCCRADAAPVVVRVAGVPPYPTGAWLRADGRIDGARGELRLVTQSIERIAPPLDPFIYR